MESEMAEGEVGGGGRGGGVLCRIKIGEKWGGYRGEERKGG